MKKKLLALAVATAIAGTTMLGVTSAYDVTYHSEANVSYTLNGNENFTGGLITITDGTETYTIMDRNLGATSTGIDSSDSYGYYFQWGNNYGFPTAGSVAKSSTQVDASGYGPGNYYSSSTFITRSSSPWDRSSVQNDNLWGGVSGTYEAMQGPCPEGYHVPSSGEWLGLSTMLGFDGTYNSNASIQARDRLNTELYLPFAGYRNLSSAGVYGQGTNAYYWSSTAYSADYAYSLSFYSSGLHPQYGIYRSDGFSVRCFKDSPYSASDLSCEEGETYYPELGVCATKGENGIYYSRDADENNDITICDPSSNGTKCITMQDKNLGASEAGTGTSSYGYHFQWGNNHGFENPGVNGQDAITESATSTLAIWLPDYNHVGYNGTLFIKGTSSSKYDYWSDNTPSNHNGLRGGENDTAENNYGFDEANNVATNVGNRQGPCSIGYHIPSQGEWDRLFEYRVAEYTGLQLNSNNFYDVTARQLFQSDFMIPCAGRRYFMGAKLVDIGYNGYLWSSSPDGAKVHALAISSDSYVGFADTYSRANGLSVRCFKDSYLEFPSSEEECPEGTHEEGDECVANYGTTGCSIYSTPANATSITGNVGITWNGSGWSEPGACNWYCNAGYHRVGDECVVNYQQTGCSIYSTPANATSITGNVGITWNGSGWSEPEPCDWYCNAGYHRVGGECVVNYQQTGCAQTGKPENSVYNIVNVLGAWNSGTNSWDIPACSWECDVNYHTEGNECVADEVLPEGIFFQTGEITYTDTNGKVFTGIGTITIRSGGETITILDRNLGATTNDISDIGSHGYYFQWGNNYGFSLDEDFQISSTAIEATDYTWNNPYVSGNFIAAKYWDTSYNSGLWGGAEDYDNNRGIDTSDGGYARQGPCPAGYHVPSIGEFDELMRITKSITGGTVQLQTNDNGNLVESNPFAAAFMSELHFPIAGYIGWDGVYTGISEEGYSYSYLWSSSFRKGNGYFMINHHPAASKKDKVSTRGNNFQQGNAFSIRCFKNTAEEGREIVLSYETRDGSAIQAQSLPVGGIGYLPGYTTHRENAELLGWYEEDLLTQIDLENKAFDEDTTIYAKWSDDYMVKFLDFDDSVLKIEVVRSGASAIAPVNPVRNGYKFNGRDLDFSNVTGDMVITAQYTKNQSTSNGGGGGGGSSLKRDNCPDGDYSDSYYDGKCGKTPSQNDDEKDSSTKPQNNKTGHNSANEVVYDTLKFNPHYSDEMNQAYQFAHHYGITTKNNIRDAAMNWELTRIAMAKMLSQYAINVLGVKPDASRNNQFKDVSDKLDREYDDGVTLAYQLGIMGINMPNNEFRPYGYVTRAEFATALSRLLYNTSDGKYEMTSSYYIPHVNKLAYEGILTNTDPYMKELRGYVMLMLMRSAK